MDVDQFKPQIIEILRSSDLAKVTTRMVREQLQQTTSVSLEKHKSALNNLIAACYDLVEKEKNKSETTSDSSENDGASSEEEVKPVAQPKKRKATTQKNPPKKPKAPRKQDAQSRENNPFTRTWILSPQLAAVTGEKELSRPGVVKHLWQYIRQHNLQDPNKKTHIFCDEKLKVLFDNEEYLSTFTMNKYIGKHLLGPAVVTEKTESPKTELPKTPQQPLDSTP